MWEKIDLGTLAEKLKYCEGNYASMTKKYLKKELVQRIANYHFLQNVGS